MSLGVVNPRRRGAAEGIAIAEEVASTVRHELRNKFASIVNAITYVERSLGGQEVLERNPRVLRFLKLIGDEIEAANDLLDQRARLAARFSRETRVLRVDECVREAVARTAVPEEVSVEVVEDAKPELSGSLEELVLAVQCLLENAVDAVGSRGRVRVTITEDADDRFVCIEDSGPGIPEAERERFIEPFVSTKRGHAGLGLGIAARIARFHGGGMSIESSNELGGAAVRLIFAKSE